MQTLVANFKGGTGKSTLVFNLAVWCAHAGRPVTVIDLDPQHTLVDTVAIRDEIGARPRLALSTELPAEPPGPVLIDVGLSDMAAMRRAIRQATQVLLPVSPSQADIWATQRFLEIVAEERGAGHGLEIHGFLNRADPHPKSRENAEALAVMERLPGVRIHPEKLVQRLAFRRSFSEGLAAFELDPRGKAAQELDALARVLFADLAMPAEDRQERET